MNQTLPIGTVLHNGRYNYRIEEVLGKGGFGITYRVSASIMVGNVPQIVPFAVKEFFDDDVCYREENSTEVLSFPHNKKDTEKHLRHFMREAEKLAALTGKTKHIVQVNESFEENGTAYFVMEYLDGGNVNQMLNERGKPMGEEEALHIILPIAAALQVLHDNHIMHLDVKPDNIMLTRESDTQQMTPVLIDFSVAKYFNKSGKPTTEKVARGVSPGYAPFEQYAEIPHFMPEIDVYALGATLLFLLTGKQPPKAGEATPEMLMKLIPADVSPVIRKAILHAMEMVYKNRPHSVRQWMNELMNQMVQSNQEGENKEDNATIRIERPDDSISKRKWWKNKEEWRKYGWIPVTAIALAVVGLIFLGKIVAWVMDEGDGQIIPDEDDLSSWRGGDSLLSVSMVAVEGGTFMMGSQTGDVNETPVHLVTVDHFYIGETEVTQKLWNSVMSFNPSDVIGDNLPVTNVVWDDANNFIDLLNERTGCNFRLPTEAEWEYAARGGNRSQGYKYSGSNNMDDVAWWDGNSGAKPQIVGQLKANELGLYDMSGNVWEWCQDRYAEYGSEQQVNPKGPTQGFERVRRGGAWNSYANKLTVSSRALCNPKLTYSFQGFRLAMDGGEDFDPANPVMEFLLIENGD